MTTIANINRRRIINSPIVMLPASLILVLVYFIQSESIGGNEASRQVNLNKKLIMGDVSKTVSNLHNAEIFDMKTLSISSSEYLEAIEYYMKHGWRDLDKVKRRIAKRNMIFARILSERCKKLADVGSERFIQVTVDPGSMFNLEAMDRAHAKYSWAVVEDGVLRRNDIAPDVKRFVLCSVNMVVCRGVLMDNSRAFQYDGKDRQNVLHVRSYPVTKPVMIYTYIRGHNKYIEQCFNITSKKSTSSTRSHSSASTVHRHASLLGLVVVSAMSKLFGM